MIIKVCEQCGKEFEVKSYRNLTARFCSRTCYAFYVRGTSVKEKIIGSNGYRRVKTNLVPKLAHRYFMEKFTGRPLLRGEHVHHINGDRQDNRIENLMIMTPKEHAFHHKQKYPLTKLCEVCGKEFMPHPTKRKRAKTCSSECMKTLISLRQANPNAPNSLYRKNAYPSQVKIRNPQVAARIMRAIKETDECVTNAD